MSLTVTNTTLSTTYAVAKAELETNSADIISKFGSIDNSDIAASAGIEPGKLSASLQEVFVNLTIRAESLAAGLPAGGTVLTAVPIPGSSGDDAWKATDVQWVCTDTGAGTGKVRIEYGEHNASGTWTTVSAIPSSPTTFAITNAAAADDANDVSVKENDSVDLAYTGNPRSIALLSDTADATAVSAAGSFLSVSIRLRRRLQSS